jgi:hypothetical protein
MMMMMTGKGNLELIVGSEPRYEPGAPNINNVLTISGKGWGKNAEESQESMQVAHPARPLSALYSSVVTTRSPTTCFNNQ